MRPLPVAALVGAGVVALTVLLAIEVVVVAEELGGLASDLEQGLLTPHEAAQETRAMVATIVILHVGLVGAMGIIAVHEANYVIEPMRQLAARMRDIGQGAFDERIAFSSYREIHDLAGATNEMSASLAMRERQVVHSERLASLGTLVAGIAHEINNPLTFMRGNEELLLLDAEMRLADPGISADERAYLEDLCRSLRTNVRGFDQLSTLSASLRVVSRVDPGTRAPVDANQLVSGCIVLAHSRFQNGIAAAFDPMARQPMLCSAGEISQVVLNLLLNAADAIGPRGHVTVETRDEPGHVAIVVSDSGPGIPDAVHARLFEPFNTSKASGTGLGLAISKKIVTAHGGTIECATSPAGTTFTVRLPAAATPMDPQGPIVAPTLAQTRLKP